MDMSDQQPWYKQFWLWFLIALPLTAVIASLYTVYIAFTNLDPIVVDNYYKEGLAINRTVADIEHAKKLQVYAEINVDGKNIDVVVRNANNDEVLYLDISHPLDKEQDIRLELQLVNQGTSPSLSHYRGSLPGVETYSRRYIDLYTLGESAWRLKVESMFPLDKIMLGNEAPIP